MRTEEASSSISSVKGSQLVVPDKQFVFGCVQTWQTSVAFVTMMMNPCPRLGARLWKPGDFLSGRCLQKYYLFDSIVQSIVDS